MKILGLFINGLVFATALVFISYLFNIELSLPQIFTVLAACFLGDVAEGVYTVISKSTEKV